MEIPEKSIELSLNKRFAEKMYEEFGDSVVLSHKRTWCINALLQYTQYRKIHMDLNEILTGWNKVFKLIAHPRSRCSYIHPA